MISSHNTRHKPHPSSEKYNNKTREDTRMKREKHQQLQLMVLRLSIPSFYHHPFLFLSDCYMNVNCRLICDTARGKAFKGKDLEAETQTERGFAVLWSLLSHVMSEQNHVLIIRSQGKKEGNKNHFQSFAKYHLTFMSFPFFSLCPFHSNVMRCRLLSKVFRQRQEEDSNSSSLENVAEWEKKDRFSLLEVGTWILRLHLFPVLTKRKE